MSSMSLLFSDGCGKIDRFALSEIKIENMACLLDKMTHDAFI